MDTMTPEHERWDEFAERLAGPEGCNAKNAGGVGTWDCTGHTDRPHATAILTEMGNIDVNASLVYFKEHGGYCDCKILLNVDAVGT